MKIDRIKTIIVIPIMVTALISNGCNRDKSISQPAGKSGKNAVIRFPVETETVKNQQVTYSIHAVGSVEAFEVVLITARVAGAVEKILFSEGKWVRANDVLVEIEPERYRLAVESSHSTWEKSKAAKAEAETGLNRRQKVVEKNPGLIPGEELEAWRTRVQTATSEVALTFAQLKQAELNLRDALVRAPVSGVVQTRTVQTGQYVQPGTIMATMIRRDPLLLRFRVSEQEATMLQSGQTTFFKVKNDSREYTAAINHVSAAADENTRMVTITAKIDDKHREMLRPGTFAEIHIPVGSTRDVPVISQTAIRPSEKGFLAYVVENGKAVEKILSLGLRTTGGKVEVRQGLKAGENLVIRGSEALSNGVQVRITMENGIPAANDLPEKEEPKR